MIERYEQESQNYEKDWEYHKSSWTKDRVGSKKFTWVCDQGRERSYGRTDDIKYH